MEQMMTSILAKPTKRYMASVIDGLLVGLLILPMFIYQRVTEISDDKFWYFTIAFFLFKLVAYLLVDVLIPVVSCGKTVGRYFLGLRLVKRNGKYATWSNFLRRASIFVVVAILSDLIQLSVVAYVVWSLVFVFSIYWIYTDDYRMTVHDKVANTIVVEDISTCCES